MLKAQEKKRSESIQNGAFGQKFKPKLRSASAARKPPLSTRII
jgi:hypothetical protein